jgi:hypothetical protein
VTDARLARCPRCKAYALVAERQGLRVALDIAPADAIAFGVAVGHDGPESLYWVENRPGRPSSVRARYSGAPRPSWGPGGAQTGTQRLHVEHSCGAPARDMVIVPVSSPKGSAPATPGAAGAGSHHRAAPVSGAQDRATPSPAPSATRHPSDFAVRCHDCRKLIDQADQSFTGIFHERWQWAVHEECP